MEGGWLGRRTLCGTTLLLMCALVPALLEPQPTEEQCGDADYRTEKGICCNKCPPGFKLSKECEGTSRKSSCVRCGTLQYMDKINYERNCKQCKRCKERYNEIVVSECTRAKNTICRCKDGFYKSVISTNTYECLTCTVCRPDEEQTQACTPEKDTECVCKDNFYREKHRCVPCKGCSDGCKHLCSNTQNTTAPQDQHGHLVNIIVGIAVVAVFLLVLVFFITYFVTKLTTQRELVKQPSKSSDESPDSAEFLIVTDETTSDLSVKAEPPPSLPTEQESSNLPDCVPLEIKIPDLIYLILDLVRVHQVKQLVRSLGVSDTVIERAELDHRSSREAHYQMLRAWAERGSPAGRGGHGGMLHRPLLQELIDTLRSIHLGGAAEELEAKYSI